MIINQYITENGTKLNKDTEEEFKFGQTEVDMKVIG
jgi:hypothetical protein